MRKSLLLASTAVLFSAIALTATPPAKKPVDFGQKMLSGVTNPLGRTRINISPRGKPAETTTRPNVG